MAVVYYPKDQLLYSKDTSQGNYEALVLASSPNVVLYFGTASTATSASALDLPITCSWARSASVSLVFETIASASWASQSLSASNLLQGAIITANEYQVTSNFTNTYTSSFIISNVDDGNLIAMTSGSASIVTVTSSVSPSFNAMFYQSGSGRIFFATGSGTVMRQRQSYSGSAGQYAVMSLIRVPNGDFVLGGDLSS